MRRKKKKKKKLYAHAGSESKLAGAGYKPQSMWVQQLPSSGTAAGKTSPGPSQ